MQRCDRIVGVLVYDAGIELVVSAVSPRRRTWWPLEAPQPMGVGSRVQGVGSPGGGWARGFSDGRARFSDWRARFWDAFTVFMRSFVISGKRGSIGGSMGGNAGAGGSMGGNTGGSMGGMGGSMGPSPPRPPNPAPGCSRPSGIRPRVPYITYSRPLVFMVFSNLSRFSHTGCFASSHRLLRVFR